MHGDVVLKAVVGDISGIIDVFVDFVFAHFLAFFFGEAVVGVIVMVVVVIDRLVVIQVEVNVAGIGVDGVCMGEGSDVGGARAGLVGTFGAQAISCRVVTIAVGASDCGAFRVEDGNLGVLGCVVGMSAERTPGVFVAVNGLVAKTETLLALDSLWAYVGNVADTWNRVEVEDFVMEGSEGGEVVIIGDVDVQGGEVGSRGVVVGPADGVVAFIVEREDVLVQDVFPEFAAGVGDGIVERVVGVDILYVANIVEVFAHNVGEENGGAVFEGGEA